MYINIHIHVLVRSGTVRYGRFRYVPFCSVRGGTSADIPGTSLGHSWDIPKQLTLAWTCWLVCETVNRRFLHPQFLKANTSLHRILHQERSTHEKTISRQDPKSLMALRHQPVSLGHPWDVLGHFGTKWDTWDKPRISVHTPILVWTQGRASISVRIYYTTWDALAFRGNPRHDSW